MKKLCTYSGCKSIVNDGSYRCHLHTPTYQAKRIYDHHYHQGKHIYKSHRWKKLRAAYLARNPLCECRVCKALDATTPADVVDHIKEISDGGDIWDTSNLQSLSTACHNRKTAEEARKRKNKKRLNGFKSLSDF